MSTTLQQLPTGTFAVDPTHSGAEFAVRHLGINTFRAGFDEIEASLVDGVLIGRVPVTSVRIGNDDLRGHVLAADFLDAESHPHVEFRSTSIELSGEDAVVHGDLTIRGTTLPTVARGTVRGPAQTPFGTTVLAIELEADVDRTAYGLRWQAEMPGGGKVLAEQVTLRVSLELVAQEG